jgi:hypothetical protein
VLSLQRLHSLRTGSFVCFNLASARATHNPSSHLSACSPGDGRDHSVVPSSLSLLFVTGQISTTRSRGVHKYILEL